MSILCQEILKRHSVYQTALRAEKRRKVVVDFVEWVGVLTLVAVLLCDHGRAASILRLLLDLIER